jgi:hypothetical protein
MARIFASTLNERSEQLLLMPTIDRRVRFNMRCSARTIYLLISGEDGKPKALHQMEDEGQGQWQLYLTLNEGTYRYRYYARDGGLTTYVKADEADDMPMQMDGFDAVLTVSSTRFGSGSKMQ